MQPLKQRTLAIAPILLVALSLVSLSQTATAAFIDAADAYENLVFAGRCHGMEGTVFLTTYLDEKIQTPNWDGKPNGVQVLPGPTLYHRKDMTNWDGNNGDFCNGVDPIPYPMEPGTGVHWTIGEKTGGFSKPDLYMYFGVGDPVTGEQTDCKLNYYHTTSSTLLSNGVDMTVTLTKSPECDNIPVMKNNLKIKQSGIYCSTMHEGYMGSYDEKFKRVGVSDGYCESSRRYDEASQLVKSVYVTSFSVYWDPVPSGAATAAGFGGFDTTMGPVAAPEAAPGTSPPPSSSVKLHWHRQSIVFGIMVACALAFIFT